MSRRRYRLRRRTAILAFCLAVLAGVGFAHRGWSLGITWPALPALTTFLVWAKRSITVLLLVILLGVSFGWWRGSIYMQKLATYKVYQKQKVSLTAVAEEDAVYGSSKQLTFKAGNIKLSNGQKLAGKVQISGFGENAVFQGDIVSVAGKLYPGFGATQGSVNYAQLRVLAHHATFISEIRRRFTAGMQTALPEPLAPFAMGLLIGQRATLPDDNKRDLLMVGLTHIIAVSGYNLTIILHASRRLLAKRSKRLSTLLSFSLIAFFLLLAGASASIVRAAIVSTLSILASYYGREFKPLNLLALTAAITVMANPFYLWTDLSWYLSFLAFFGVMLLAPLVLCRTPKRWQNSIVVSVALESVCAEVMTLPIILYEFGQMSLIGLPANVMVVTLVPLAMLLSLIAGLAGMLVPGLCGWLAWPAVITLNYMLDIAHYMAHLPHVFLQNRSLPFVSMLGLYAIILLFSFALHHKTKS